MIKRVLYFVWAPIHRLPPCVAQVQQLRDFGIEVSVLSREISPETAEIFRSRNISYETLPVITRKNKVLQKGLNYLNYRRVFRQWFRKYWTDDSVLWIGSEMGAIKQWHFLKNHHPVIVNCLEFFEYDWYQNAMKRISSDVDFLTACEPHRAQYMKDWWNLGSLPVVLRNKPYALSRSRNLEPTSPDVEKALKKLENRHVLLYQGMISKERDLSPLAEGLKRSGSDWTLALMGTDYIGDAGASLQKIYPDTVYLGYFYPPHHFEITSHADICVACYEENSINTRYCAPNKIYEYAAFGLPMLCNDIPGLEETVGRYHAGKCVNFHDPDQIAAAIRDLTANYEDYSAGATRMYEETDNTAAMQQILETVSSLSTSGAGKHGR